MSSLARKMKKQKQLANRIETEVKMAPRATYQAILRQRAGIALKMNAQAISFWIEGIYTTTFYYVLHKHYKFGLQRLNVISKSLSSFFDAMTASARDNIEYMTPAMLKEDLWLEAEYKTRDNPRKAEVATDVQTLFEAMAYNSGLRAMEPLIDAFLLTMKLEFGFGKKRLKQLEDLIHENDFCTIHRVYEMLDELEGSLRMHKRCTPFHEVRSRLARLKFEDNGTTLALKGA